MVAHPASALNPPVVAYTVGDTDCNSQGDIAAQDNPEGTAELDKREVVAG